MLEVDELFEEGLVFSSERLNFELVEDQVAKLRRLERGPGTSLGSSSSPSVIIFWTCSRMDDISLGRKYLII
jgi:hypothetical protein